MGKNSSSARAGLTKMATWIGVSCITVLEPAAQIMGLDSSETMLMYNFKRLDAME